MTRHGHKHRLREGCYFFKQLIFQHILVLYANKLFLATVQYNLFSKQAGMSSCIGQQAEDFLPFAPNGWPSQSLWMLVSSSALLIKQQPCRVGKKYPKLMLHSAITVIMWKSSAKKDHSIKIMSYTLILVYWCANWSMASNISSWAGINVIKEINPCIKIQYEVTD